MRFSERSWQKKRKMYERDKTQRSGYREAQRVRPLRARFVLEENDL